MESFVQCAKRRSICGVITIKRDVGSRSGANNESGRAKSALKATDKLLNLHAGLSSGV